MYVCLCRAVTREQIRQAIDDGATDPVELARRTGAGTECGGCLERMCAMLRTRGLEAQVPQDHDQFLRTAGAGTGPGAGP